MFICFVFPVYLAFRFGVSHIQPCLVEKPPPTEACLRFSRTNASSFGHSLNGIEGRKRPEGGYRA